MGCIVNGGSYRAVDWWTNHLQSKENDSAELVNSFGLRAEDVHGMLEEMMDLAHGTKCQNPFYQMNINPEPGERLNADQWERAREIAEKEHGLEGQPYFVVEHVKHGRLHQHIVWSRIDLEKGRAISDSHDARKNHAIGREIALEFGLKKVIGPYDREPEMPRPPHAPKPWEMYRDKKHGLDTRSITAEVTELRQQSDTGAAFHLALGQNGYELVTGRRGLLILDSAGSEHSLARRCGLTTKELNAFMRDVDRAALPTVEQAKEQHQERKIADLEADRATIRDEIQWQEALDRAGIEKEERERRFVEPEKETWGGAIAAKEQEPQPKKDIPVLRALAEVDDQQQAHDPYIIELLKQDLAEIDRALFGGPRPDDLKRDPEDIDKFFVAEQFDRYINDPDIYHFEMPRIVEKYPALASEVKSRLTAAIRSELEQREAQEPDIIELLKQDLAEIDRALFGAAMPDDLKREPDDINKYLVTVTELFNRYVTDLDAHHHEISRLVEEFPATVLELERRMQAAFQEEIDKASPRLSLDDLWPNENGRGQAHPKPERAEETRGAALENQDRPAAPELGKTQAEIRLARSLSPGPQTFANALEDRGFILASITADDIQRDIERLVTEWEQRRQNPQAWMEHNEGYAALKPEFQESARRSFDAWEKQQEQKRQKHQEQPGNRAVLIAEPTAEDIQKRLESYVKYVQGKWAEGPKSQLERATGGLAVVTPFGSVYTLTPRNTGLDRDELTEYLKGIDRKPLLSVTDAQAVMQDVREQRREEWKFDRREEWLAKQPLGRAAAEIRLAYSLTQTGPQFAEALEDKGLALACMSEAEAERLNRWERQRLKEQRNAAAPTKEGEAERQPLSFDEYAERLNKRERQRNPPAPPKQREAPKERDLDAFEKYRAGELVIINQYGAIFQLTAATTGAHAREREERLNEIDRAALLSVTAAQAAMRDYQEHRREERREIRQQEWEQQRAARQAERDRQQISDGPQNLKGPALHIWNACTRSDSARAFLAALDEQHIALATPTKEEAQRSHMNASFAREVERFSPEYRDGEILAVTLEGQVYKLTPRNTGMTREDMEAFLAPLDRSQLHGIAVTQESQQKRLNEIHWPIMPQPEKPQQHATGLTMQDAPATSPDLHFQDAAQRTTRDTPPLEMPADLRGIAAEIWTAYNSRSVEREWQRENADGTKETQRDRITLKGGRDPLKFGHALDQRGLILARATKEEAEQSQKDAEHYKGFGDSYRSVYQEGEFVVIDRRGEAWKLTERTTGHAAREVQAFLNKAEWKALPGIEAGRQTMKARSDERLAGARDRAAHWDAIRLKNATRKHGPGQGRTGEPTVTHLARPLDTAARASRHVIGGVFGALRKLADGFSLDALTPKEKYEAAKRDARNEREADKNADYAAYIAELSAAWRRDQQRQAEQQKQQREPERER